MYDKRPFVEHPANLMTPQPRRVLVKKVSVVLTATLEASTMPVSDYSGRDFWTLSPATEAEAKVSRILNPSPSWFMVHGQLVSYDVERRQERRIVEPGERMVLITPDAGALFVWRWFTESGRTTGGHIAPPLGGNGRAGQRPR